MADELAPGMTYGRYKIPDTPNGLDWLKQFAAGDPEGYAKIVAAMGGEGALAKSYAPAKSEYMPGTEVVAPGNTTAVDEYKRDNQDAGEWYRANAYDQQPGFTGQFQRYLDYVKQGLDPQEAQDRIIGAGKYQSGVIGLEGTANVNPATGKAYAPGETVWDPKSSTMKPTGAPAPAAAPALKPTSEAATATASPELIAWAEGNNMTPAAARLYGWDHAGQSSLDAIASAMALQNRQSASGEALMQNRTKAGSDPYTGFNALKQQATQESLGRLSAADRNTMLTNVDPINLTEDQRLERKSDIAASNLQKYGVKDVSDLNQRTVYEGGAGARHLNTDAQNVYQGAGRPGGFDVAYGDKTYTDPATGREMIYGNVPTNIGYKAPKVDAINKIAAPVGSAIIGLGSAVMGGAMAPGMATGGAISAGTALGSGAMGGLAGMGAGTLQSGRLPTPTSAAIQMGLSTILGGFGAYRQGLSAAKSAAKAFKPMPQIKGI